jgi:hypothetical protein
MSAGANAVMTGIKNVASFAMDHAKTVFNKVLGPAKELFEGASEAFGTVKGVLSGLLDSMKEKLSAAGSWIKDKLGMSSSAATPAAATTATPAAAPGAAPTAAAPVKLAPAAAVPQKAGLSAAEKAAVMETVAQNTKYTNDLLVAQQKAMDNLQRQMLQQLAIIASHTGDGAAAARKTAKNTG